MGTLHHPPAAPAISKACWAPQPLLSCLAGAQEAQQESVVAKIQSYMQQAQERLATLQESEMARKARWGLPLEGNGGGHPSR